MKRIIFSIVLSLVMVFTMIPAMTAPAVAAVRTIITTDSPYSQLQKLHTECEKVTEFDANLSDLIEDLTDTLKAEGDAAVCLSAPQVGVNSCVCVIKDGDNYSEMVNPEITGYEGETQHTTECLSAPNISRNIVYPESITVKYYNGAGSEVESTYIGVSARAIVHAISHMDGVMINDNEDCTVAFNANGHGTAPASQNVTSYNLAAEPEAPAADGWDFAGWYRDSGCMRAWDFASDAVTEDITLYAKWTELLSYYTYTETENSVTITGYTGPEGAVTVPGVINGKPVTEIGQEAFDNRGDITSVILPDSITTIDDGAFQHCSSLIDIKLPKNLKSIGKSTFLNCSSLTSLDLPEGLEIIGDCAFQGAIQGYWAESKPEIILPSTLKKIGDYAFKSGSGIGSVELNSGLESIGTGAFQSCQGMQSIVIKEGITTIQPETFDWCTSLHTVVLPDGLLSIGAKAFNDCYALKNIDLPDSVTEIGENCFEDCDALTEIILPYDLKTIGNKAFYSCSGLKEIVFPPNVESVGDDVFLDTENITEVYIMDRHNFDEVVQFGSGISKPPTDKSTVRTHEILCLSKEAFEDCGFDYDGTEHIIIPDCSRIPAKTSDGQGGEIANYTWEELKVTEPGTYELTVKAANPKVCYGEKTLTFKVNKKELAEGDITISGIEDCTYTGKALKQNLVIKCGETELVSGADYRIYYDNNIEPGTAQMDIVFKGNYKGTIEKTFHIEKASIEGMTAKLSDEAYEYSGTSRYPAVEIAGLRKGTDFTVTYPKDCISLGEKTVAVEGTGNYEGTIEKIFVIKKASIEGMTAKLSAENYTYSGKAKKPSVAVSGLKQGTDFTVTYKNNVKAGKASVTIQGTGNYEGTVEKNFTIEPASISGKSAELAKSKYVYSGKANKPVVTISGLNADTDFTVDYKNNVKAGKAAAAIKGKGNYKGTITKNFKIVPKKAVVSKVTAGKKKLTVNMNAKPAAKGAGKYQIAYRVKGTSKWKYTTMTGKSKVIKSLKKGKRYQIKVRALKKVNKVKYYGAWSKTKCSKKVK